MIGELGTGPDFARVLRGLLLGEAPFGRRRAQERLGFRLIFPCRAI